MGEQKYPFPPDCIQKYTVNWWETIMPRLFGQKFEDYSMGWHLVVYWYRGICWITKYERI